MSERLDSPEENRSQTSDKVEPTQNHEESCCSIEPVFRLGKAALERSEFESDNAYAQVFSDAPNPTHEITMGDGEKLHLTRSNTTIYEFPHYPEFDHIYHVHTRKDETLYLYFWKDAYPAIYQAVKNKPFNLNQSTQPTEGDYKIWNKCLLESAGLNK